MNDRGGNNEDKEQEAGEGGVEAGAGGCAGTLMDPKPVGAPGAQREDDALDDAWLERMKREHPDAYDAWWSDIQDNIQTELTQRFNPNDYLWLYELVTPVSARVDPPPITPEWVEHAQEEFPEAMGLLVERGEQERREQRSRVPAIRRRLKERIEKG